MRLNNVNSVEELRKLLGEKMTYDPGNLQCRVDTSRILMGTGNRDKGVPYPWQIELWHRLGPKRFEMHLGHVASVLYALVDIRKAVDFINDRLSADTSGTSNETVKELVDKAIAATQQRLTFT